jgi:hypothetical protein
MSIMMKNKKEKLMQGFTYHKNPLALSFLGVPPVTSTLRSGHCFGKAHGLGLFTYHKTKV